MKSNKVLYAVILVMAIIICLLVGYVAGTNNWFEKKENNNQQEENKNDNNQTPTPTPIILNYEIKEENEYQKRLIVNGNSTDLIGFRLSVDKLSDALLVNYTEYDISSMYTFYVVDANGKISNSFIGAKYSASDLITKNYIKLKGNIIRENYVLDGADIYIKSDNLEQDPEAVVCSANNNDIVEYTEKITYLGNGKFSDPIVSKTVTSENYKIQNGITCR